MRTIIFVKHARPEQIPAQPSHEWPLSEAGKEKCLPLAEKLAAHRPAAIVSSSEPKAIGTARIIADKFAIPVEVADGLEEHDRSNVPLMRTGEFVSTMSVFFKNPARLVLGRETAQQALDRFESALAGVLEKHTQGNLAVVSHGTVLALYLAKYAGLNGYELWRAMGLPSYVAVEWPSTKIIDRVDQI